MVYTCDKCGKPTMKAYSTSDGYEQCLCATCCAEYERELKNKNDSESVKNLEQRINRKIKDVIMLTKTNKNRLQEHEVKNGNLEKRIEKLESKIKELDKKLNEYNKFIEALSEERVKQIAKNVSRETKKE